MDYHSLGVEIGLKKEAQLGRTLGHGAAKLIEGLIDYGLIPGAKNLARAAHFGLKTPGLGGPTLAGLGLGASAANEGLGAAASYTGLPIPHLFGSEKNPLWSPHNIQELTDPTRSGWSAIGHALTRPIQTAQNMLGYGMAEAPEQSLQGFDPWTGKVNVDPTQMQNLRFDPRKGNATFNYKAPLSPVATMGMENAKRLLRQMNDRGISTSDFGSNTQSMPSVLQSRPLTLADL